MPCPFPGVCGAGGTTSLAYLVLLTAKSGAGKAAPPTEGKIVNSMESLDMSREEPAIAAFQERWGGSVMTGQGVVVLN